ncbi:MAG: RNA methyltransferase [Patescibacteria group bacterium]|nr:RNA methyltransferase [Patescibacteria group bacterium]MDD5294892.1 RNA methyltransferase [Patescibacteria group bacterium]MDD5554052.1 RNA methyltransferase [Patescibacteria group bacterium]
MREIITSAQNQKIKEIIRLRKPRERKKQDLIIVEGWQEIGLARQAGLEITELFFCQDFAGSKKIEDLPEEKLAPVVPTVFTKISYRENPDGFLALAKPKYPTLEKVKLNKNPLIIILESLEKPGNLGAILRSADAAGVDAVIVADPKTDIYNPNVIRASLGTVFTNQVAAAGAEEIKKWLAKNKIKSFAATPEAKKLYTEANYKGAAAIIMGEEHPGLSKDWLKNASEKIRIPMAGKIDSLNVSVSTAIILFEAIRKRKKK